jgi:hypothetical protein
MSHNIGQRKSSSILYVLHRNVLFTVFTVQSAEHDLHHIPCGFRSGHAVDYHIIFAAF